MSFLKVRSDSMDVECTPAIPVILIEKAVEK
jgi:hypothetical protein